MRTKSVSFKRILTFSCMLLLSLLMLSSAVLAEEEQTVTDEAYAEHVREVQKEIRTNGILKYGMMPVSGTSVKDGTYEIDAASNSTYFKIAKAVLTVKDGEMTAEITIPSMSYTKVFMGTSLDAKKSSEKEQIGFQEVEKQTVFTVPVEALDKEIPIAALSKARQKWYDRKVVFYADSLPEDALLIDLPDYDLIEDAIKAYGEDGSQLTASSEETEEETPAEEDPDGAVKEETLLQGEPEAVSVDLPDGEYSIDVVMTGGSGRASVSSPTWLTVRDGKAYAKLLWSSSYYDYMLIGDKRFDNLVTDGGNSQFEIPIVRMDESFPVIADTTAMGDPVEIRYELTFYSESIGSQGRIPQEAAKKVLIIAVIILVVGFVLNLVIKKVRAKGR